MAVSQADQARVNSYSQYLNRIQPGHYPTAAPPPPKAPARPAPPPAGPTGFWGRISQVGIGKVNAINAYRAVAHSGPTVKSNNQPVKQTGRGIKAFGKAVVSGEKTVATGIARELPGGNADLEAQNRASSQAVKDVQFIKQQAASGKISKPAAARLIQSRANDTSQISRDVSQTVKAMPTKKELAAGFGNVALDVLSGGGGNLALRQGAKYTAEKGAARLATGKLISKVPEALQTGKKTQTAVIAATGAAGGASNAQATRSTGKQTALQTAAGAAIPLGGAGIAKLFEMGPRAALSKVKSLVKPGEAKAPVSTGKEMQDVLSPKQADKAAAAAKTKISVGDLSSRGENVNVRTPVRPGVKQVSETTKIGVRTPQRMTDQQFHQEFNKLSKGYDQEMGSLQKEVATNPKPSTQQAKIVKAAKPDQEPVDGYHHSSELIKDHAEMMKQIDDHARGGVKIPNAEGDGMVRTSEHTPFFRQFFQENGRAPSMAAYKENAERDLASGKAPYGMSDTYKSLRDRETGAPSTEPRVEPVSHDQSTGKLMTRQAVAARTIDAKYEKAMNDLVDRYHNPELSPRQAPKTIAKQTLRAGPATGGAARSARTGKLNALTNRAERSPVADQTAVAKEKSMPPELRGTTAGVRKTSTSALKTEARAVEAGVTKELADKATYAGVNHAQEAEKAVKLLDDNPEKARSIAFGHQSGDNMVHEVAVRRAVERRALQEADGDTIARLAASSQHTITSEAGQRLGAEAYNTVHNSPVDAVKDIIQTRQKAIAKGGQSVDSVAKQAAKEIQSKIKAPSKDEWQVFVESIKC